MMEKTCKFNEHLRQELSLLNHHYFHLRTNCFRAHCSKNSCSSSSNTGSSRGFTLLPCFSTALKQKPQQNTTSFSRTNWAVYASRERETHPCKYWCSKTNTYRERLPVNHKIRIKREFIWKLLNCNSLHKAIKILEWYCKQFTQREMTKCQNTTSLITKCVVYASRKRKNISL